MEVEYRNLYTHFVFTTQDKFPCISEEHRERIEKYITGIINRRKCRLSANTFMGNLNITKNNHLQKNMTSSLNFINKPCMKKN